MKKIAFIFISFWFSVFYADAQLTFSHNGIRAGDELIKQQVEFVDPGSAGGDQIWDFSKLKTVNDEYTLTYSLPPMDGDSIYILGNVRYKKKNISKNELIVGTEHNTMYYYHISGDSLLQTGHENPSVELEYIQPMVQCIYPVNYGQRITSNYESAGLYSATVAIHNRGTMTTIADAYGKLLLPSKDTINSVLRVKTTQTILEVNEGELHNTETDDTRKQVETCRWYSKGYRYPVFETVRSINLKDSTEIFKTAFFFPPQDHFYLDTDKENLAILDSLWNMEQRIIDNLVTNTNSNGKLAYSFYPNPVISQLTLQYDLESATMVTISLFSMDGKLIKTQIPGKQEKGSHTQYLDCSSLSKGTYILRIEANNKMVSDKIIKK